MSRGGRRQGAGRPGLPLADVKVKRSVSLSLTAFAAVSDRALPGEAFSATLDRILNALPVQDYLVIDPPTMV